jgi:hypothetical protein
LARNLKRGYFAQFFDQPSWVHFSWEFLIFFDIP